MTSLSKAAFLLLSVVASLGIASVAHANFIIDSTLSAPASVPNTQVAPPTITIGKIALTSGLPPSSAIAFERADPGLQQDAVLPEPATIAVLGIGLMGLGFLRRTRAR